MFLKLVTLISLKPAATLIKELHRLQHYFANLLSEYPVLIYIDNRQTVGL